MNSLEDHSELDTIGDSKSIRFPTESLPVSITDDYYSKYNSEYQDGVLTELGNAATDIRDRAINVYHQSRDSMTSLRDGMRLEADKTAELARVRLKDAKDKVEEMSQASKKHLRRTSQAFKTAFIGTKK